MNLRSAVPEDTAALLAIYVAHRRGLAYFV